MSAKSSKGLGKGLGALLGDAADTTQDSSGRTMLPISHVEPNSSQPRHAFNDGALEQLSDSIKLYGIIQPLIVRRLPSGYYQIIAGERRWRAARLVGLSEVPAIIIEADDRHTMEIALIENLQREDLNAIEEAEGFRSLIEEFGLTQDEAATRIGRSRPALTNSLRLLSLPDEVKALVVSRELSGGHARTLLPLSGHKALSSAVHTIVSRGLSVRETESLVKKLLKKTDAPIKDPISPPSYLLDLEKRLSGRLGRRVHILAGRKKGKIELEFYDNDDLDRLLAALEKAQIQ